jgi:hypothetical protein
MSAMNPLIPSVSALAVSAIYCLYQAYARQLQGRRERVLRERVAFMLWVAASRAP